jgi:hypothetical protein
METELYCLQQECAAEPQTRVTQREKEKAAGERGVDHQKGRRLGLGAELGVQEGCEHSSGEIKRAADTFSGAALPQGEQGNADQKTDQRFKFVVKEQSIHASRL